MDTNFHMIRDLKKKLEKMELTKGILYSEEIELIKNDLCLKEMDALQAQNLRDFAVMFLSNLQDSAREAENMELFLKISDISSKITHVIDMKLHGMF